jgi:hypothetical protein
MAGVKGWGETGQGHKFQPSLPALGLLSLRLQSWLPRVAPWGWSDKKQKPFCGAGILRIATAGLQEVPPTACHVLGLVLRGVLMPGVRGADC